MKFWDPRILSADDLAFIQKLELNPGWQVLGRLYEQRVEAEKRAAGDKFWAGAYTINEIEAAELRGFWKGVRAVLDTPQSAGRAEGRTSQQKETS